MGKYYIGIILCEIRFRLALFHWNHTQCILCRVAPELEWWGWHWTGNRNSLPCPVGWCSHQRACHLPPAVTTTSLAQPEPKFFNDHVLELHLGRRNMLTWSIYPYLCIYSFIYACMLLWWGKYSLQNEKANGHLSTVWEPILGVIPLGISSSLIHTPWLPVKHISLLLLRK